MEIVYVSERVCVCVCVGECMCVRVCEKVCERERESGVYVCERMCTHSFSHTHTLVFV